MTSPILRMLWRTLAVVCVSATDEITYTEGGDLHNYTCRPADCVDLQCFNVAFEHSGPHRVYVDDGPSMPMSCEVDAGGGWTVMQVSIGLQPHHSCSVSLEFILDP